MNGQATRLRPEQLRWLIAGLMIGLFLSSTEQSVVATALPTIAGELGGANRLAWVVSAYLLSSTVVTPLYGKMSDLFGRRVVYQTAIVLFLVGSGLCGLAQTMNQLVAARVFQGLGGGGLMSLAFVILGDVVSPRERGRYIGVFTAVFTFSAVTGPLWGGLLVDSVGWRWVFWSVVPLSIVALLVANRGLRLPFSTREAPIDWAGIVLLVIASTALILVPIWGGGTYPWGSAPILVTAFIGVVASVGFVIQEQHAVEPIVPLRLFRTRSVATVFAMGFCLMASLIAVSTFLPLFLQVAKGVSATRSGLLLTPQSIGISLSSTVAGFLVSRSGRYKWTLLAGPLTAVVALSVLSTMDPGIGTLQLAPILFVLGAGLGLTFPNMTLSVQNASPVEDLGVATSVANFFRSMGGAFGSAIAGAVLTVRLDASLIERLGADRLDEVGGAEGLIRSPKVVRDLPPDLKSAAIESVTDAVTWVITVSIPVMVVVFLLALMVVETPLRTSSSIGGSD
ncbi:MAG: MFS transporter [Actinomycetia bacterium]|nr:MFS transporter [Actinomycetes bacterium]